MVTKGLIGLLLMAVALIERTKSMRALLNLSSENCQVNRMQGPYKMTTPWQYSSFNVELNLKEVKGPKIEKISANIMKVSGDFGSFRIYGGEFIVNTLYFKSPGEHDFYGFKYSAEMQFVGLKNKVSKAVITVHLEEIQDGDNPELAKIGFANNTLGSWGVGKTETLTYTTFDPKKFVRSEEYVLYVGTSTNENCEKALIIHTQNSEFISKAQMMNFGGSDLEPVFQPKMLTNDFTVMQNFASFANDMWDPLKKVLLSTDYLPSAFPVPIQFSKFMYNPLDQKHLGDIPEYAIPFWKPLPPGVEVTNPAVLPRVALGYKVIPYYHILNLDSKKLEPRYIVVPNSYVPNPGARPNKVPIAIRSKMAYPNLSKEVVNLEMIVNWTPEPVVQPPPPPKAPVLPPVNPNYTITPLATSSPRQSPGNNPTVPRAPDSTGPTDSVAPTGPTDSVAPTGSTGSPQRGPNGKPKDLTNAEFNISKICTKIRFEVILNIRRSQWDFIKNLPENMRAKIQKCEQFQFGPVGLPPKPEAEAKDEEKKNPDQTQQIKTTPGVPGAVATKPSSSPDSESVKVTKPVDNATPENKALVKRFCQDHQLHVVLNRKQVPHVQDYVKHFCKDKVIENTNMKDQVMLARLKGEMATFLARRVIAKQAMDVRNAQVGFQAMPLGAVQSSL